MEYAEIEQLLVESLEAIKGKRLVRAIAQILEPEFNLLYLVFEDASYQVSGRRGSEVIGLRLIDEPIPNNELGSARTIDFAPFSIFVGHTVAQARPLGRAWNGHGLEIVFVDVPGRTLLVQSIYGGHQPEGFEDCLRLGVGQYWHDATPFL